MPQSRPELRAEIRKIGNRYMAVVRQSDGLEILSHEFQYDTGTLMWLEKGGRPERERPRSRAARQNPNAAQVKAQGWQLFSNLFGNGRQLRDFLTSHRDYEQSQLILSFDAESASLSRLPWEYLYDGHHFLCVNGTLLLSRRPEGMPTLTLPVLDPPLHILVVIAAPEDQVPFDGERELTILQESLNEAIASGAIIMDVLPEPTSQALLEAVQSKPCHIVHLISHATYRLPQHQGYLCFEDEIGRTEHLNGTQLLRFLRGGSPRMVLLAACPAAQLGTTDALASVATELLQYKIPAVVSVPRSLRPPSAIGFYQALYENLAAAHTLATSLHQGRLALKRLDDLAPPRQRQLDWGHPTLHERCPQLQIVRPASTGEVPFSETTFDRGTPASLVGRKRELQAVRKALKEEARIFYIWGSEGVGKSDFTSHLLSHLTPKPTAILSLHCREMQDPLITLDRIARFWRSSSSQRAIRAAQLLLDANQPPLNRAQEAQQLMADKRYLFRFEELDAWFGPEPTDAQLSSTTLHDILVGMLSVPSESLFFFTGTRRWAGMDSVPSKNRREITLPLLPIHCAVQMMNRLSTLHRATFKQKHAVYWYLGGHPKSLVYLDSWVRSGHDLGATLETPPVRDRSTEAWSTYLVEQLLDHLDPGEYEALRALAILKQPFSAETISALTPVTVAHAEPLLAKWYQLGLAEPAEAGLPNPELFDLPSMVRRIILQNISALDYGALQAQAAAAYGAPFVDAARRQVLARNITSWSQERIEWLARDTNGVLGLWLRQQEDEAEREALLDRAMAWQHHLLAAGEREAAAQIIQAIAPELCRQGQRDLARALLQRTLTLSEDLSFSTNPDQLAMLGLEEGPLSAALNVYEELYKTLDPQQASIERAHVLMRAGVAQQRLGDAKAAIRSFELALQTMRRKRDREGEAECLYRLAAAYRGTEDMRQALVYSQAAREHYEALAYPHGLALVDREQGLILRELGRLEGALERFAASLRVCRNLNDRQCIAANLTEIGLILEKLGRTETAIKVIEEALQHYEHLRSPEHGEVLALLEHLYTRKQRFDEARARIRTARGNAQTAS